MFELPNLPTPTEAPIVVVDVETTGFEARTHEIISIALILCDPQLNPSLTTSHFVALERPHTANPDSLVVAGYHGHAHLWESAITQLQCAELIAHVTRDRCLLAHNIDFDRAFLAASMRAISQSPRWRARQICTLKTMRMALKSGKVKGEGASLQASCARFGIHLPREEGAAHFALDDAEATRQLAQVLVKLGALRIV